MFLMGNGNIIDIYIHSQPQADFWQHFSVCILISNFGDIFKNIIISRSFRKNLFFEMTFMLSNESNDLKKFLNPKKTNELR